MKLNKLATLVLTGAILSSILLVGCTPAEPTTDTGSTGTPTTDSKATSPETTTPPEAK